LPFTSFSIGARSEVYWEGRKTGFPRDVQRAGEMPGRELRRTPRIEDQGAFRGELCAELPGGDLRGAGPCRLGRGSGDGVERNGPLVGSARAGREGKSQEWQGEREP
jgi:hypothetical protein